MYLYVHCVFVESVFHFVIVGPTLSLLVRIQHRVTDVIGGEGKGPNYEKHGQIIIFITEITAHIGSMQAMTISS